MFDPLSDALARLAFSRLAPDRPHPRADLDRLPPLLAHTLRRRLHREAIGRLDVAAPWVSSVPDLWREDAIAEARYPASAWSPAVREASAWLFEALVRPAEAIAVLLPETGETPTAEVLDRMQDLGAYPYLAEVVQRYAEKKERTGYDRETLRHLLGRVDHRLGAELDADGWQALLRPLYDLVGTLPEFPDGVPGRVLAEVFAARGCPGLGAAVVTEAVVSWGALPAILAEGPASDAEAASVLPDPSQEEPTDEPSDEPSDPLPPEADEDDEAVVVASAESGDPPRLPTLAEALADARAADDLADEAPADEAEIAHEADSADALPEADEPSSEQAPAPAPPDSDVPPEPSEADEQPLWARYARESGTEADAPTDGPPDASEPLWRRFAENAPDAPPPTPAEADLDARVLGPFADQRATYIESLFGGDEADYTRVLGLLDEAASWSEATEIIGREVFRRYRVHIYSEPAASFTDAVEAQMRART